MAVSPMINVAYSFLVMVSTFFLTKDYNFVLWILDFLRFGLGVNLFPLVLAYLAQHAWPRDLASPSCAASA